MSPRLDLKSFEDLPKTLALAVVVDEETEARRTEARDQEAELRQSVPPPSTPIGQAIYEISMVDAYDWSRFMTDFGVINRCCERLKISGAELLERVSAELYPTNWETIFWMRAWMQDHHTTRQSEIEQRLAVERKRAEEAQQLLSSAGGHARAERLYGTAIDFVNAEWASHGQSAYEGNKSEFARIYVRRVRQEFGTKVTERTITTSWLKGK